jgi:hypothetical protein
VTLTAITSSDDGKVGCYGRGACCRNNPGWFGPGEMEKAAEHMGMEPEAFFRKYLVVVSTPVATPEGRVTVSAFARPRSTPRATRRHRPASACPASTTS